MPATRWWQRGPAARHDGVAIGWTRGARRLAISVSVVTCSVLLSVAASAQTPAGALERQLVVAAVTEIDGWLRGSGLSKETVVTYTFDEGLGALRDHGSDLVQSARAGPARWARAVNSATGCPEGVAVPGCPQRSEDHVVTLGAILEIHPGVYSVQFDLSRPQSQLAVAREVEVRYFRLRRLADGTFARIGEVGRLIP